MTAYVPDSADLGSAASRQLSGHTGRDDRARYRGRSKIRLVSLGHREQSLVEIIQIVLGADRLLYGSVHLEPALLHSERFVERVGVLHRDDRGHVLAVRVDREALYDVQLLGVRRAKIIDV